MNWTLARAKDRLSEVVRRAAAQGPQTVSVRGHDVAVVISKSDYDNLLDSNAPKTLKEVLSQMDLEGVDLTRDLSPPPDLML